MLGLMREVASEVPAHHTVPGGQVLAFKGAPDLAGNFLGGGYSFSRIPVQGVDGSVGGEVQHLLVHLHHSHHWLEGDETH